MSASLPAEYFDALYATAADPWGFATRWYERRKYACALAVLPQARYRRGYEPGCSIGVFTEHLATRCDRLLATDVAQVPLSAARDRLARLTHVEVKRAAVPSDWPPGSFDLIVISELGYYLDPVDLQRLWAATTKALEPGGTLLAVHWRHPVADYPQSGDEVAVWERNVGAARRTGFAALLQELGADRLWLASSDADSQVPPSWLLDQLAHAHRGADAVAGMVSVTNWNEHPPTTVERLRRLHHHTVGHPHVHGANLGVSADAYLAVDGFHPLPAHEDVALITALKRTGHRVLHTADAPVLTSARRHARATAGFADFLIALAEPDPDPVS